MSSYFIWDNQLFDLQIPSMDDEHKKLISLMNVIYNKNQSKSSKSEILTPINELLDLIMQHFHNEESYMEKVKFPGLANHRSIHHRLLAQFKQHKQDFESDSSGKINEKFFDFLALWLTAHIQYFDRQYSLWTHSEQDGQVNR